MIKCFEANYPESLGSVLVHKAPWLFQGTSLLTTETKACGAIQILTLYAHRCMEAHS